MIVAVTDQVVARALGQCSGDVGVVGEGHAASPKMQLAEITVEGDVASPISVADQQKLVSIVIAPDDVYGTLEALPQGGKGEWGAQIAKKEKRVAIS